MRLRGLFVCLVILGVLAVGTGYLAIRNVDVDTYRALIAAQVEAATGRTVAIGGDVELRPSLHPTIVIEQVSLSNAPWGSRPRMVAVKRLELQASLLPLLKGRIEIGRVVLSGVDLFLETDVTGRRNWDFGGAQVAAATAAKPAALGQPGQPLPMIGTVVLQDAVVTFHDAANGRTDAILVNSLSARSDQASKIVGLNLDGAVNGQPVFVEGRVGALSRLFGKGPYPLDLVGRIGGSQVTVKGDLIQSYNDAGLSVGFTVNGQSLADLGALAALDLPAIGPYSLAAALDSSGDAYALSDILLQVGSSDLSGSLTIQPREERWQVSGALSASRIDLADFAAATAATGGGRRDGRLFSGEPLPLSLLGALDGTIELDAEEVVARRLTMENLALDLALAGGRLDVTAFEAGLAGGRLAGTAALETGKSEPRWTLRLKASRLAAGDLLRMLTGDRLLSGGRADLAFDLSGRGNSVRAVMASLAGAANGEVTGGVINDDFIRIALVDLLDAASFTSTGDGANLNCAVTRFAIDGGVARARRLALDARGAALVGEGRIDLRRETIALRFKPTAKQASLAAFAVPFDVTGRLADPSVRPDPAALATNTGIAALAVTGAVVGRIAAVTGVNRAAPPASSAPVVSCGAAASQNGQAQSERAGKQTASRPADNEIEGVLNSIGNGIESLFDGSVPANNKASRIQGSKDTR